MHLDHPSRGSFDEFMAGAAVGLSAEGAGAVLRGLVGDTGAGVVVLDRHLRVAYANAAFARMVGERAGDRPDESAAAEANAALGDPDLLRQVLRDGRPRTATIPSPSPSPGPGGSADGTTWWHAVYHRFDVDRGTEPGTGSENGTGPGTHGLVGIVVEAAAPVAPDSDLARAHARIALLDDAAQRVGTTLDPELTCQQLAEFAVPQLADAALVELVPAGFAQRGRFASEGLRLHRAALAALPSLADALAPLEPGKETRYAPGSAVVRCLVGDAPVLDVLDAPAAGPAPEGSTGAEGLGGYAAAGVHSVLAVPLTVRGRLVGTLSLARAGSRSAFTGHDTTVATDLARRSAVAIDNATRYARSQSTALQLQRALLAEPGNPHLSVELASRHAPSGTSTVVGGDWSEAVRLAYGRTLLVIGDVMGHGVEAAVDMSGYRSLIRYLAGTDLPPHRILRQVDTLITQADTGRPATCLLALLDPARGRCTYASAGHLPPALFTADDPAELVQLPVGPPLGTGFGGYESATRPFLPGQVLLMYTDGLVERRGEDIDASLERLARIHLPVTGDLDRLLDTLMSDLVTEEPEDDIAVLAARIRPRQSYP